MEEFCLLKAFQVRIHHDRAPRIFQVDWLPPTCGWIKCNTDRAAKGSSGHAGGGRIFRGQNVAVLGCFSIYFGICNSVYAELRAAMYAIETASHRGLFPLWLECDSSFVVTAFSSPGLVPWKLRTRWHNCIHLTRSRGFRISHIYREGNQAADKLANFGVSSKCFSWWDLIPPFITVEFFRNRFNLPNYRFG